MTDIPVDLFNGLTQADKAEISRLTAEAAGPPVFYGRLKKRTPGRRDPGTFGFIPMEPTEIDDLRPASEALLDMYGWDEPKLRDFQERAFRAGLYGTDDRRRVRFGDWDSDTASIWRQMVDRSGAFYAAGRKVTPFDALAMAERSPVTGLTPREPAQPRARTNPLDVEAFGRAAGHAGLGRGLTDAERAEFEQGYRGQETPLLHPDSATADPSAAGWEEWAEGVVRDFDPVRFDARKVLEKFDVMARWMRGEEISDA